jgi:hypothetical protein
MSRPPKWFLLTRSFPAHFFALIYCFSPSRYMPHCRFVTGNHHVNGKRRVFFAICTLQCMNQELIHWNWWFWWQWSKLKLSLCLTKYQDMKTHGEVGVQLHVLTSVLYGGEWSASRPGRFDAGERTPGTQWIGGWVCLTASGEKNKSLPSGNGTPVVQTVAQSL